MTDLDPPVTPQTLADEAYPPLDSLGSLPARVEPCAGCSGVTDPACCLTTVRDWEQPEGGYGSDDDLPGMWTHADFT